MTTQTLQRNDSVVGGVHERGGVERRRERRPGASAGLCWNCGKGFACGVLTQFAIGDDSARIVEVGRMCWLKLTGRLL